MLSLNAGHKKSNPKFEKRENTNQRCQEIVLKRMSAIKHPKGPQQEEKESK